MTEFYDAVRKIIPRLRRYGCLLTGSRTVADDYAQVCLERLILQGREAGSPLTTVDVFQTFHRVVSDAEIRLDTSRVVPTSRLEYQWLSLPVDQRTAVLLVHAEGFTRSEATIITGLSPEEFQRKLQLGRATISGRIAAPVFIIGGEGRSAPIMTRLVEALGHDVCGIAPRGHEARAAIDAAHPALILADVEFDALPDEGLRACEDVCSLYDVPVIYLTGHADRVRDFVSRSNAFVIAKPFEPEILRTTMGLALGMVSA
jgi:CheY-like chemotaxis protein